MGRRKRTESTHTIKGPLHRWQVAVMLGNVHPDDQASLHRVPEGWEVGGIWEPLALTTNGGYPGAAASVLWRRSLRRPAGG